MMVRYHVIAISLLVYSAAYGMNKQKEVENISDKETHSALNPLAQSQLFENTDRSRVHHIKKEDLAEEVTTPLREHITEQFKTASENQNENYENIVKRFDAVATKKDVESFLTKEEFETKLQEIMQAIVKLQPVKQVESAPSEKPSEKPHDNQQKKQLTKKQKISMVFVAVPVALLLFFIKAKGKK